MTLDKAINPYRDDIAAIKLKDLVAAPKYATPNKMQITKSAAFLKSAPNAASANLSEALQGEIIDIYETKDGFAWGQMCDDDYVGYVETGALSANIVTHTHKISALRAYSFAAPSVKANILQTLSMGAQLSPTQERENGFVNCGAVGWVYENAMAPINQFFDDPAALAVKFRYAPYCWGGKQSLGLDCSGLVQVCFAQCGIKLPRDARMQEFCGEAVDFSNIARNDLLFWQGHVAIALDNKTMVHANAFHMCVDIEPIEVGVERYDALNIPLRAVRRISNI